MVEAPKLDTIEVGNTLTAAETSEIEKLINVDAFDEDTTKENTDEMKDALKATQINVVTSDATTTQEVKTPLSLGDIATQFDKFVEQGDGWKLKLKDESNKENPAWITYIVNNPKNNDLAYLVQKLAEIIEYRTAKAYTVAEVDAVKVGVDKTFGNQTRRALAGLKNWIENDATAAEKTKFLKKSIITDIITKNTNGGTINKDTLNKELLSYNLVFDDDKRVKPIDGYTFIDPNSTNYATKEGVSEETKKLVLDIVSKDPDKYFLSANGSDFVPKTGYTRRHMPHTDDYAVIQQDIVNDPAKYNIKIDTYGTYSPVEGYHRANKDDPNDYSVIKEASSGTEATTKIDIEKKLDTDMYDGFIDNIEKTKISDFINKYKSTYPGIEKCFVAISQSLVVTNESNPYFQITYKDSENATYNSAQTGKISMRECMDFTTFDFVQDKFFEKLLNEIKPTIEANNAAERNGNILKLVRGSKFSKSDLFGNTYDTDNRYKKYFEKFKNSLVEIDDGAEYTFIEGNKLKFRLDNSGGDEEYNIDKELPLDKITDTNGKLDKDKLKKELALMVSDIIDKNLS